MLVSEHLTEFDPAEPPVRPHVDDNKDGWCDSYAEAAVTHLPSWRLWRRHKLRTRARTTAERAWPTQLAARNRQADRTHDLNVDAWNKLLENDEPTVVDTVTVAFADNDLRAVATGVEHARLTILVAAPPVDTIPEREPATTQTGTLTTRQMSRTRRNDIHAAHVASHTLAAVREAFAVAPAIGHVLAVAVNPAGRPVLALAMTRDQADQVGTTPDVFQALELADDHLIGRKGRTRELSELPATWDVTDITAAIETAAIETGDEPDMSDNDI